MSTFSLDLGLGPFSNRSMTLQQPCPLSMLTTMAIVFSDNQAWQIMVPVSRTTETLRLSQSFTDLINTTSTKV